MASKIIKHVPASIREALETDANNIFALSYLRQKFHIVIPDDAMDAGWKGIKKYLSDTDVPATVTHLPRATAEAPQGDVVVARIPTVPGPAPAPAAEPTRTFNVRYLETEKVKLYGTRVLEVSGTARIPESICAGGQSRVCVWLKDNRHNPNVAVEVVNTGSTDVDYDSELGIDITAITVDAATLA